MFLLLFFGWEMEHNNYQKKGSNPEMNEGIKNEGMKISGVRYFGA